MIPIKSLLMRSTGLSGGGGGTAPSSVQAFSYTGAEQTTTVPSGITEMTVWLWGGAGGNGNWRSGLQSGAGGFAAATFTVSPGDTLKVEVGGGGAGAARGANGGAGGWPDGGGGGKGDCGSGGGGGSTRFYINGVLKAVAGGGGGNGGNDANAGAGGGSSGQSASVASSGTGGTQSAGGVDGNDTGNANKTGRSIVAYPGVQRTGGWGANTGNTTTTTSDDGGGGGGGYWGGGGGGGDGSSGGGGSSWADASASNIELAAGVYAHPRFAPPGQPALAKGVPTFTNGSAVAGGNGYALLQFGGKYKHNAGANNGSTYSVNANEKGAIKITLPTAATVKKLQLATGVNSSGNPCRGFIMADNAGVPGSILYLSATGSTTAVTTEFDMADTVLAAGDYWIGYHLQNGDTLPTIPLSGSGMRYAIETFASGTSAFTGTVYGATPNLRIIYA